MNNVVLVGRLTKNAEMRYTPDGKAVSAFTLAVDRPFLNQKGDREVDFIRVVVWGRGAENVATYCGKGSLISVMGRIQTRSYEKGGEAVYVTEVIAERIQFLDTKKPSEQPLESQTSIDKDDEEPTDFADDDLPF